MPERAVMTLLTELIDYAGLFPPAKLEMAPAVSNYAKYLASEHAWMLGRFVVPVSKLELFRKATVDLLPREDRAPREQDPEAGARGGWRLSAIIDGDLDENIDSIFAFNHEHEQPGKGLVVADTIELKVESAAQVDESLDLIPEELFPFFELPLGGDLRGFATAIAGNDAAAKIRTGGITPEAIPAAEQVASFIATCAAAQIPFKATAGLHHPIRAEHALTYEPDAPRAVMHGFLNVFLAAAAALEHGLDERALAALLEERDPAAFTFTRDAVMVRGHELTAAGIARTRESFALSFGSCSFTEPVDDLTRLGWL